MQEDKIRIISKFKDYYDSVQSYGQDDLVYVREPSEIEVEDPKGIWYCGYLGDITSRLGCVGFCGNLYPYVTLYKDYVDPHTFYSVEEVTKFVVPLLKKKDVETYHNKYSRWSNYLSEGRVKRFFEEKNWEIYHKQLDIAPIFVIEYKRNYNDPTTLALNPPLKNLQFYKLFDSYTAFQELFMYISNTAQPEKGIPKVSDSDMIVAKGFDKHSFRKQKK